MHSSERFKNYNGPRPSMDFALAGPGTLRIQGDRSNRSANSQVAQSILTIRTAAGVDSSVRKNLREEGPTETIQRAEGASVLGPVAQLSCIEPQEKEIALKRCRTIPKFGERVIPGGSVHGEGANFTMLVLGCIAADLANRILKVSTIHFAALKLYKICGRLHRFELKFHQKFANFR